MYNIFTIFKIDYFNLIPSDASDIQHSIFIEWQFDIKKIRCTFIACIFVFHIMFYIYICKYCTRRTFALWLELHAHWHMEHENWLNAVDESINVWLFFLIINRTRAAAADVVSPITSAGSETGNSKVRRVNVRSCVTPAFPHVRWENQEEAATTP